MPAATQAELQKQQLQLAEVADKVPGVVYQFYARPDCKRDSIKSAAAAIPVSSGIKKGWERSEIVSSDVQGYLYFPIVFIPMTE